VLKLPNFIKYILIVFVKSDPAQLTKVLRVVNLEVGFWCAMLDNWDGVILSELLKEAASAKVLQRFRLTEMNSGKVMQVQVLISNCM